MAIFRTQIIVGVVFAIAVFVAFNLKEHGDLNVVILGVILYVPYVAILCLYNGVTIALFERVNERQKWMNYFLPVVPLLIWFFLSAGSIKIRYWNLEDGEFFVGVFLLALSNAIGYLTADRKQPNRTNNTE
jgi:hypothetical protein